MRVLVVCLGLSVFQASPVLADCGFCAREVTLSQKEASCYLEQLEAERARALELNADFHLIDLSICDISRGLSMPQPKTLEPDDDSPESDIVVDDTFMIPISAMDCLADVLRDEDFNPEAVKTFEVRSDC